MSVIPSKKREYPGHADYDLAVQNIGKFVFDSVLKAGKPRNRQGGGAPLSFPGGFAKAYVVDCGAKTYALRVWLHDIGDAAHHYHAVASFFVKAKGQVQMECFVEDFHFIPDGILVNGQRFPILRMEWVSGSTLGDFITKNIGNRALLKVAASAFLEMVKALHQAQVAHGDLQAENMIVCVVGRAVRFKLIDYDTLVVPALVGRPISSTGLQCYQHPRRGISQTSTVHDDYFSELVIYVCLLALSGDPGLWREFPPVREKELLFAPEDFSASSPSPLFRRLYEQGGMVKWLAVVLWNFSRYPGISQLQPLEKVIELATEALGSKPAVANEEQKGQMPARNRFDDFLKQKMGLGQGVAVALPKSWVDEEAFLRPPAPAGSSASSNRGGTGNRAGMPGAAGGSFADKLKGMQPARPAAAAKPAPAPATRVATAKPVGRMPSPWIGRMKWVCAIVAILLMAVMLKNRQSGMVPTQPVLKRGFSDAPAFGKNYRVRAGMNMVWIAPGSFQMGDSTGKGDADEKPVHEVRLTAGCWIGESEVTQGQWQEVMGNNPSRFKGESLPVENVSWDGATDFCRKLTERERAAGRLLAGMEYRLPTEAQWEYACRAGSTGDYTGDLDAVAWHGTNSGATTHQVKTKQPNAWGLYDMHGNVWEWCSDWYASYSGGMQTDPKGPETGTYRAGRGGSWFSTRRYNRSATRIRDTESRAYETCGFRLTAVLSSGRGTATGLAPAVRPGVSEGLSDVPLKEGTKAGEELEVEIANGVKVRMCWMPAGNFTMGSPVSERGYPGDEAPVQVRISRGFWMAKTECTQKTWTAVMGSNPSNFKGADLPVEHVSWDDCQSFIAKLRQPAEGRRFDLPTEAQWEYACRAGTSGAYSDGLDTMGWYSSNSGSKTHLVGMKKANAWGLMDMHGNVWEWCRDAYVRNLPGGTDPGVLAGASRVSRGGSWSSDASLCRSAYRNSFTREFQNYIGFRLAAMPGGDARSRQFTVPKAALEILDSPEQGKSFLVQSGMKMVWIPPGSFQMGDSSGKGSPDEKPLHEVQLVGGYWLGESIVTQAQWEAVMGSNPSHFKGENLPVETVNWNEAMEYCRKLTEKARAADRLPMDLEYRLPTEAQWEYACRGGSKGDYSGDLNAVAWYDSNSGNRTHEVKSKPPNMWGLYDMHGNVWEWCSDWNGSYLAGAQANPTGPDNGTYRVLRGGSWNSAGWQCRSSYRGRFEPGLRYDTLGFRVAVVPTQVAKNTQSASALLELNFSDTPTPGKNYRVQPGITMVWIAPGSFQMGNATNGGSDPDEKPVHEVRVSKGYWLGESKVTQALWRAVMGNSPSHFNGGNLPVESVNWNDAMEFCQKLTQKARAAGGLPAGMEYLLPTEAQWEYACRAGTTGDYAGDLDAMAWYASNSQNETHEVKLKRPNAWGLYDMHGNVREWCADWYGNYPAGMQTDPGGAGNGTYRVLRGGAWNSSGARCRSSYRDRMTPDIRSVSLGFRLATVYSSRPATGTPVFAVPTVPPLPRKVVPLSPGKRAGEEREVGLADGVSVTMCWVPEGRFTMGSPASETGHSSDEGKTDVRISRGFWLAKTECTQRVWIAVMGTNPSQFKGDDLPVEQVSWHDCKRFIGKLRQPGEGWWFDLPTEAQWEYACRAGTAGSYSGFLDALAWHDSNSGGKTHSVGTKKANGWGLQDMHGNVWEWCSDWYAGYSSPSRTDPTGPINGTYRVFRGGSWFNTGANCRSAFRNRLTPMGLTETIGFRLAAVPTAGARAVIVPAATPMRQPTPKPIYPPRAKPAAVPGNSGGTLPSARKILGLD